MAKIFFSFLFSVFCVSLFSADTLKIHITRRNIIGKNNEKSGEVTISQKFYTLDDTLFREIRYDESTGELSGYTFYFYQNGLLSTEEIYGADDKVTCILKHDYDKYGNRIYTSKIYFNNDEINTTGRSVYKFTDGNRLVKARISNGKKTAVTRSCKYDKDGKLLHVLSIYTPFADTTIRSLSENYEYDSSGKISAVYFSGEGNDNSKFSYSDYYAYNENKRLVSITRKAGDNSLISAKTFTYYASGTIRDFLLTDGEGIKKLSLSYEYRTNVMNRGVQKKH